MKKLSRRASRSGRPGEGGRARPCGLGIRRWAGVILLTLLGGFPLPAEAQPARRPYRIGVLNEAFAANHPTVEGLKTGLRELGLVEGRDVTFHVRFTEGKSEAMAGAVGILVDTPVDVILTSNEAATQAAQAATRTIPIVFTLVGDPVAAGIVTNPGEPEGNVTGVSSLQSELVGKRLEILKTLAPATRRVRAVYYGRDRTGVHMVQKALEPARRLGLDLLPKGVLTAQELALALRELRPGEALLAPETANLDISTAILDASLAARVPAVFTTALWVGYGGLVSYGPDYHAQGVQAAGLVAKILRGARPQDLPVEGAEKIELAVNLKTADLLRIAVPRKILLRADTFRQ